MTPTRRVPTRAGEKLQSHQRCRLDCDSDLTGSLIIGQPPGIHHKAGEKSNILIFHDSRNPTYMSRRCRHLYHTLSAYPCCATKIAQVISLIRMHVCAQNVIKIVPSPFLTWCGDRVSSEKVVSQKNQRFELALCNIRHRDSRGMVMSGA